MRPIDHLRTLQPDTLAIDALRLMGREDVHQLPVIGRRHILQLLQARAKLNLPATPNTAVPLTAPRAASAPVS